MDRTVAAGAIDKLAGRHPDLRTDIQRGVTAAAKVYENAPADFDDLCVRHYAPPGEARHAVARRLDSYLASLSGHLGQAAKELRWGLDVDAGPLLPVDELCAAVSPYAHFQEDLRSSDIAAVVQLNFGGVPDTPDAALRTPDEWLAIALSRVGTEAVPAALRQQQARVMTTAERLVQSYNLLPGRIRFEEPGVTFPKDLRLISHWGLRDYLTGLTGTPDALPRQRALLGLMERVVRGRVPEAVLDNPAATWDLAAGTVAVNGTTAPAQEEGDRRWRPFHDMFQVHKAMDPHRRRDNLIDTVFLEGRRMTEERVEGMLVELLSSPLHRRIGRHVEERTGRPLEPFDVYYKRFQDDAVDAEELGAITRKRFPDRDALQAALPAMIEAAGFPAGDAADIAAHIRVDPARSAGHAWPPATPDDLQLLRVRVEPEGVSWQEFGTYMHELGHCVEGVLSTYDMPYRSLWGVPATAFSEAFAFTFQDVALEVLGQASARDRDVETIQRAWEAYEIAGPSLVEMRLFRWLYEHPDAGPGAIHEAVQRIGDEVWASYYAPVLGEDGHGLMSVYSHMLWGRFYLPEYPLGYIIAYQVRRYLRGRDLASEMTRMCRLGDIYPDAWMTEAVGESVSVEPLLGDAAEALDRLGIYD